MYEDVRGLLIVGEYLVKVSVANILLIHESIVVWILCSYLFVVMSRTDPDRVLLLSWNSPPWAI